jgi:RNA polymerase sigma factor (sigma-70 family)
MRTVAVLCRGLIADSRPDGELLAAFASGRDEAALTELVRRHGPLVWGTCRRLLHDPEDAFQATFLVLVRRAGQLSRYSCVGPWLHRVTVLTAKNVRRKNVRRLAKQTALPDHDHIPDAPAPDLDLKADLDAALLALPSRYRDPIVLCHLLGFTRREAAERLGCPEGTLSGWLNRGLAKLRDRLRGLDPARVLSGATVAVPAALCANTARAAVASTVASASVPPAVSLLVEGVLRMFWVKKAAAASVALCAVFAMGVGIGLGTRTEYSGASAQEKGSEKAPGEKPKQPEKPPEREPTIAELEAQIHYSNAAHKAALEGVAASKKRIEVTEAAKNATPKDIQDGRDVLRRFQQDAEQAAAQLKNLEAKLAKLKGDAKQEPWYIDLCVGGKKVGTPFEVKEQERNGGPFGSAKIDTVEMLARHMVRVKRDPLSPPALRIVIWEDAPNDRIKAAFRACQTAGYKEAIVSGKVPTNDPEITFKIPKNDPGGVRDGWFEADEVLVKLDELLKPAKK